MKYRNYIIVGFLMLVSLLVSPGMLSGFNFISLYYIINPIIIFERIISLSANSLWAVGPLIAPHLFLLFGIYYLFVGFKELKVNKQINISSWIGGIASLIFLLGIGLSFVITFSSNSTFASMGFGILGGLLLAGVSVPLFLALIFLIIGWFKKKELAENNMN